MLKKLLNFRENMIWKILLRIQQVILVVSAAAIVLILCAETVLRYFFHSDLFGYEEVVIIFAMWLYFLGASYAMYRKSHIKADIVGLFVSERVNRIIKLAVSGITMLIAVAMMVWAWDFFHWALEKKAMTTGLRIPLIISQSALFFGYTMITFYAVVYFLEDLVLHFGERREGTEA